MDKNQTTQKGWGNAVVLSPNGDDVKFNCCLLYTSDAADERSSVDLGGRRIIKKKKSEELCGIRTIK